MYRTIAAWLAPFVALTVATEAGHAQESSALVRGTVADTAGIPISHAEVVRAGSAQSVRSDSGGRFRLNIPAGPQVFMVRRVGFRPLSFALTPTRADTFDVSVIMEPFPHELARITVEAERADLGAPAGRPARLAQGGTLLTRAAIDALNPSRLSDVFRGIPGIQVARLRGGHAVQSMRAVGLRACSPQFYLDGLLWHLDENQGLDVIPPQDIERVEIYRGPAELPIEFAGANAACGVIVIWTRRGR